MKIELRKVKHSPSLSQETNAYTAEVWVDGVRRGTVRNDGSGGPDHVEPGALAESGRWEDARAAQATIPDAEEDE